MSAWEVSDERNCEVREGFMKPVIIEWFTTSSDAEAFANIKHKEGYRVVSLGVYNENGCKYVLCIELAKFERVL